MTQKQKAAAYDELLSYLRWSFDYSFAKRNELLAEGKNEQWHTNAIHESWTALNRVNATDGRECPCWGCDMHREKREKRENPHEND